jgi:hypothetical protein
MRRLGCSFACMLLGCGPEVVPAGGSGSGSEGSTGGPMSATTVATTVAASTGPGTSVSTTSTTNADDTTDGFDGFDCGAAPPGTRHHCVGKPPWACDPPPMLGTVAWVSFDGGELPAGPVTEPYVYGCTIAGWEPGAALVTLALACEDGEHTLEIGSSAGIWFRDAGDFVLSVVHSDASFGSQDQLVTLRRADGELVLAGASTPWPPDFEGVPADFFAPLEISLLTDVCPLEPPPDGTMFVDRCFTLERQALRFSLEGRTVEVYDHGVDQLAPYIVAVQDAEQRHDIRCTDTSEQWYSWVAAPTIPD